MKCTWPTRDPMLRTQRKLYSTGWRWGLASGITQILALGNAKIYQHVGISNAKFLRRGHCPTPTPDARYFASQWNIGLSMCFSVKTRGYLSKNTERTRKSSLHKFSPKITRAKTGENTCLVCWECDFLLIKDVILFN